MRSIYIFQFPFFTNITKSDKSESGPGIVHLPHIEILILLNTHMHAVRLEAFTGTQFHDVRQLDRLDASCRHHVTDDLVDLVCWVDAPGGIKCENHHWEEHKCETLKYLLFNCPLSKVLQA